MRGTPRRRGERARARRGLSSAAAPSTCRGQRRRRCTCVPQSENAAARASPPSGERAWAACGQRTQIRGVPPSRAPSSRAIGRCPSGRRSRCYSSAVSVRSPSRPGCARAPRTRRGDARASSAQHRVGLGGAGRAGGRATWRRRNNIGLRANAIHVGAVPAVHAAEQQGAARVGGARVAALVIPHVGRRDRLVPASARRRGRGASRCPPGALAHVRTKQRGGATAADSCGRAKAHAAASKRTRHEVRPGARRNAARRGGPDRG